MSELQGSLGNKDLVARFNTEGVVEIGSGETVLALHAMKNRDDDAPRKGHGKGFEFWRLDLRVAGRGWGNAPDIFKAPGEISDFVDLVDKLKDLVTDEGVDVPDKLVAPTETQFLKNFFGSGRGAPVVEGVKYLREEVVDDLSIIGFAFGESLGQEERKRFLNDFLASRVEMTRSRLRRMNRRGRND